MGEMGGTYGLIFFALGTSVALYLTRTTARAGFRHGLARFFAFEAILGFGGSEPENLVR